MPQYMKGALIYGAAGGSGVFVAKDEKTGEWSEPAFFTMCAASFGFQFGAQMSEVVLLVLTQRGVDSLLLGNFKLGRMDRWPSVRSAPAFPARRRRISVRICCRSCGPKVCSRVCRWKERRSSRGTNGAAPITSKAVSPTDIVIRREVKNPHSDVLRAEIGKAIEGK